MKTTFLLFLTLLFLNTFAQEEDKDYLNAKEFIKKEKYKKALTSIDKALKESKEEQYLLTKVTILQNLNTPTKNIISFLNQHINENSSSEMYIERGYRHQRIYRFQDAILDFTDAIKKAQKDSVLVRALDQRGSLYQKIRKPKLAKEDYERAYALDSNNYSVCNNFSIVLDDLGQTKRAKDLLLKLVKKDSTSVHAVMNLGFFASLHEEYEEALFYLNKALELEPEGAYTLSNISFVKLKLNMKEEALKDVNKSLTINKSNSYAYKNRALILIALNKKEEACKDLETALEYGFKEFFGSEVNELIKSNCIK